eukprot:TRINITY_DN8486_c0_g1_i1.p1 TRINITY_DN8486_c0_g1~~TRINITY_DN8486_c0_g1_i1.p1  ORF type:complete len:205 (+),score=14.26 TRINITY_DN8486_c0_g1_i1:19-633(+)
MKRSFLLLGACVLLVLFVRCQEYPLVQFESFEMSKCPYTAVWKKKFEETVMKAEGIAEILNLTEYFVAEDHGGKFECLHGAGECQGNMILICAYDISPANLKWWDMSVCMQAGSAYQNIPSNAEHCAETAGLDYTSILDCVKTKGPDLFRRDIAYSQKMGVKNTPTSYINGDRFSGGANDPLFWICNAYTGPAPKGCAGHVKSQ